MKLGNTGWLIWSLLLPAFMQCQKIPEEDFIAQPTELQINVTANGDESENTYVYLFRDRTSFESRLGPVAVDTTDEAGRAFFTDLLSEKYYILAQKEGGGQILNNAKNQFEMPDVLVKSALTDVNIPLQTQFNDPPDSIQLVGVHYTNVLNESENANRYEITWYFAKVNLITASTYIHVYNGGKIMSNPFNDRDTLGSYYSEMEDLQLLYPLDTKFGVDELDDELNNFFFYVVYRDLSTFSSFVLNYELRELLATAATQEIRYPTRIRVGQTPFAEDNLNIHLILEWK